MKHMNKILFFFSGFLVFLIFFFPLIHLGKSDIKWSGEQRCESIDDLFVFRMDKGTSIHYKKNRKNSKLTNIGRRKMLKSIGKSKRHKKAFMPKRSFKLLETINLINPQEFEDVSNFLLFDEKINLDRDGYGIACVKRLNTFQNGILVSRMVNILEVESFEFVESLEDIK